MKIYLIGVDIVEVFRIKKMIEKYPRFVERIYTQNEIFYCESRRKTKFIHYSARFAAKEACAKALGMGIGKNVKFREIEVNNRSNGAPYIKFYGKTDKFRINLKIKEIKLSISCTQNYAVASAISVF